MTGQPLHVRMGTWDGVRGRDARWEWSRLCSFSDGGCIHAVPLTSCVTLVSHLTSLNLHLLISKMGMLNFSLQGCFKDQGKLTGSVMNECGVLRQKKAVSGATRHLWLSVVSG